jgi:3-deoxy-D-manno-octulosonic-acid transferase
MRIIYSFVILFYTSLIHFVSLFNRKAFLWVSGRRGWRKNLADHFSEYDRTIWIHCASLGEFEQGRPVIERIRESSPGLKILVTFFSPSGYEIRKNWPFADYVCYLPADIPRNAARFVKTVRPVMVILVKYEFWANYISEVSRLKIPLYLVSGIFRPEQHFFKWYGGFFRNLLRKFTYIFVQDKLSCDQLAGIGLTNVSAAGDTRFDRVSQVASTGAPIPAIETFRNGEKLVLAGSSWPQDEEIIARYINKYPGKMKWVFAPHEIGAANIDRLQKLLRVPSVRFSDASPNLAAARVLIIDNIGLLSSAYRYAHIASIGGGFGRGIHNILEAACWGIPVLFGPNHLKFREAVELKTLGGAFSFTVYDEFESIIEMLAGDEKLYKTSAETAHRYISENRGATERIVGTLMRKDINN